MKMINGWPCKRLKTATGRKYWVKMTEDEIIAHDVYQLTVVLVPALLFLAFCWASGILL